MEATIKDNKLIVTIPLNDPRPSSSGKTLVVASSSGGKKTGAKVNGQEVSVNITAWIKKD